MAIQIKLEILYTCDAPGCGKQHVVWNPTNVTEAHASMKTLGWSAFGDSARCPEHRRKRLGTNGTQAYALVEGK